MPPIADALTAPVRTSESSFADFLHEIYTARYTGAILLHVADGIPRVVQFMGRQVRLESLPTIQVDNSD